MVKNLPTVWETQVLSLNQEDPLEKGMATDFNILAWRIPWTEEPWAWWATVHGFTKSWTRLKQLTYNTYGINRYKLLYKQQGFTI